MTVPRRGLQAAAVAAALSLLVVAVAAQETKMVADEDLMKASPLTVAQCRAGCLHKVSTYTDSYFCTERVFSAFFPHRPSFYFVLVTACG